MKTTLAMMMLLIVGVMAYAAREAASAGVAPPAAAELAPEAAIDEADAIVVEDRYLVPALPASVVERLPATEIAGDRYLPERIALAELVVGQRILAAEELATAYARELPGFTEVLLADGFRQDADGTWYYDRYSSWMRFPLNR
jgi:hypothetical protein